MKSKKPSVQSLALILKYTHSDLDTSITQFLNAPTLHLSKLINAAHHHTLHTFLYNKLGTGRCFPIMRTGFQRYIHRGHLQQRLILWLYRGKGIHLSMPLSAAHMITFADDLTFNHNHRPHHRIRFRILSAVLRQLQTATHVFFIQRNLVGFHILYNFAI